MALLPPYDFNQPPEWWAQSETQWWDDGHRLIHRPTEDHALLRITLKNWALRDGHYWELLHADEKQLHLTELWLIRYLPTLPHAQARARWVHNTLYPHLSVAQIIAMWDVIDEVLCSYAHTKLSLEGLLYELWR